MVRGPAGVPRASRLPRLILGQPLSRQGVDGVSQFASRLLVELDVHLIHHPGRRVAEASRHSLHVPARCVGQARARVPQPLQTDGRDPAAPHAFPHSLRNVCRRTGPASSVWKISPSSWVFSERRGGNRSRCSARGRTTTVGRSTFRADRAVVGVRQSNAPPPPTSVSRSSTRIVRASRSTSSRLRATSSDHRSEEYPLEQGDEPVSVGELVA
jgi:hypothetical protein